MHLHGPTWLWYYGNGVRGAVTDEDYRGDKCLHVILSSPSRTLLAAAVLGLSLFVSFYTGLHITDSQKTCEVVQPW